MKYSEFKKWIERQGAVFVAHRAGSSHFRVTLNGITTIFPYRGSREMGKHLEHEIKKQLGLK
nr:type II toxin-antitoxin system HicA family toxin [Achromobacter insuavis]